MVDKGFYQIVEMPTQGELNEYYKKHPHQPTYAGPYATTYSASDEEYMTGLCRRIHAWIPESAVATSKHFLDIGSTTGFCLDLFQKRGYTVKGISSQLEIIKAKHPHLKDSVIVGNVVEQVNKLVEQNQKFSVIILLHVMNRVLDPAKLLDQIKNILGNEAKPETPAVTGGESKRPWQEPKETVRNPKNPLVSRAGESSKS